MEICDDRWQNSLPPGRKTVLFKSCQPQVQLHLSHLKSLSQDVWNLQICILGKLNSEIPHGNDWFSMSRWTFEWKHVWWRQKQNLGIIRSGVHYWKIALESSQEKPSQGYDVGPLQRIKRRNRHKLPPLPPFEDNPRPLNVKSPKEKQAQISQTLNYSTRCLTKRLIRVEQWLVEASERQQIRQKPNCHKWALLKDRLQWPQ